MSFPSRLSLDDVIKRLQAYKEGFNLYTHKNIDSKWVISYGKEEIEKSYPLTAPSGKNTHIDIQRLKVIAKHFHIPDEVFTLTAKEIKKRDWP